VTPADEDSLTVFKASLVVKVTDGTPRARNMRSSDEGRRKQRVIDVLPVPLEKGADLLCHTGLFCPDSFPHAGYVGNADRAAD
jgi:hypothetical protein